MTSRPSLVSVEMTPRIPCTITLLCADCPKRASRDHNLLKGAAGLTASAHGASNGSGMPVPPQGCWPHAGPRKTVDRLFWEVNPYLAVISRIIDEMCRHCPVFTS